MVRQQARWLAAGGVGLAGFQYCYLEAVSAGGVSASTAIAIGLAPVFTGTAAWMISARPTVQWFIATGSSIAGLALMLLGPSEPSARWLAAIAWSTIAAAMFSLQIIAIERTARTEWTNAAALAWMFATAALLLAPVGLGDLADHWPLGPGDLTLVLYAGGVTAGLAYWLFAAGTKAIGAPAAATISLLEPATAVLLAVVFLGEQQSGAQWVGMLLLLSSVTTSARSPSRRTCRRQGGRGDRGSK